MAPDGKTLYGASPWSRCWLEGAGAGVLVALPLLWLELNPGRQTHYHELLPMNSVYQGLLIDLVVCIGCSVLLLWLLERGDRSHRSLGWALLLALLAVRVVRGLLIATVISPRVADTRLIFLVAAFAGLVLWIAERSWYSWMVRGARTTLLLLGFSIFWIGPELVVMAFQAEPREAAGFKRLAAQSASRRIVWILFDEASYDQLFDHPQPDAKYPNFNRLASGSLLFTDVQPAGYFTERVVPSLLEGETVTEEKSDLQGRLFVKTRENPHWRLYPDRRTLFADAQREGWSTGVVGWYNPYCRTEAAELDDCYWTLTTPLPGRYSQDGTAWCNAVAPLGKSISRLFGQHVQDPAAWQMHAADYEALMAHVAPEIAGDGIGFLFLHLPVPHPGGFYSRKTGQIGVDGSYLDNLALTDATLGELLREIDGSTLGSRTTVIVSSDHSWRVALWQPTTDWRPEDTRVSGGRFDSRPLLLVHFPGESTPIRVNQSFPLIRIHGMIEGMLAGRIGDPAELGAWAAQP